MVHAAVEEILPGGLQQHEAAGQLALQVERLADVGHRPVAHPGLGIGERRHVQPCHVQRQFAGLEEYRLAVDDIAPGQRLAFAHRPPHGGDQQRHLHLAGEGDAFGGVEHGAVFVEQVAVPQALLRIAQRSHAAPPCCWICAHQPLRVGVLARSVKLSSSPCSRHSLSNAITWIESRP
ncbi:hypothetical protein BAY1663_05054 [Pseudomonas sp. BAY1663]|nr:hypothetical protein BAY1663_05054 [Pseudomonas sp. BAY1663]